MERDRRGCLKLIVLGTAIAGAAAAGINVPEKVKEAETWWYNAVQTIRNTQSRQIQTPSDQNQIR